MPFTESAESSTLGLMRFALGPYAASGGALITRESAAQARVDLERSIVGQRSGEPAVVALDFSEIAVASVSFADEFLGPLLSGRLAGYYEEHPLIAVQLADEVAETLDAVLGNRRLTLLGVTETGPQLLGGDDLLERTFQAALAARRFRATELADALSITPQAMNNRLKTLVQSGALLRTRSPRARGGKEFEYIAPLNWLQDDASWLDIAGDQGSLWAGAVEGLHDSSNEHRADRTRSGAR